RGELHARPRGRLQHSAVEDDDDLRPGLLTGLGLAGGGDQLVDPAAVVFGGGRLVGGGRLEADGDVLVVGSGGDGVAVAGGGDGVDAGPVGHPPAPAVGVGDADPVGQGPLAPAPRPVPLGPHHQAAGGG